MSLKREYTAAWLAIVVGVVIAEFYAPVLFVGILPLALLLEGVGIARTKRGDTASENVWSLLYEGGRLRWARIPLVGGFTVLIGVRLYELGLGSVLPSPLDVGRLALVCGLVLWLIPHFIYAGKHG